MSGTADGAGKESRAAANLAGVPLFSPRLTHDHYRSESRWWRRNGILSLATWPASPVRRRFIDHRHWSALWVC